MEKRNKQPLYRSNPIIIAMPDKKCFIIMPVSTPPELVSDYNDDSEHFLNVMEQLFIPAIKEAGFEPIKPITKGSDIIHGHIISNLQSSDLVLCDMSTKNPNVFFELGIRTVINKPICLVKDNLLEKVPFDTSSINYHEYSSDIRKWIFERERLAKHIKDSFSESDNCNSLWKYFGTNTQSKEVIAQFEDTITQFKKEQQIKDIENRLEKFYIPAEDIINGKLKKNREQTINGWPLANYIGLKDLRKYSYLADNPTFEAYETYIESNCRETKEITCQDKYSNKPKGFTVCEDYKSGCHNQFDKCPHNLDYCEHYNECPKKDQVGIIQDNTKCEYYIDLKKKIAKDIEDYKNELIRLKK